MKLYCLFFLSTILVLGCSQDISKPFNRSLVISSEKEIISDIDSLENHLAKYIKQSSIQDIFEESWLSSIKTDYLLNKSIAVEIKEHHPIARLEQNRYV